MWLDSLHMPVHIELFYRTGLYSGLINCKYCEYRCIKVSSWESSILNQYSPRLNHFNLKFKVYSARNNENEHLLLCLPQVMYVQFLTDSPLQASILPMFVCLGFPHESWEFLQPKHNKLIRNTAKHLSSQALSINF